VGNQFQRQLLGVEDFTRYQVGQRHFGSRDQVEVSFTFAGDLEQVFLELRQLASALQCRRLHQVRGVMLLVAVLAGVQVDHELRQGAVQAGDRATQHGKTGARQLGCGLEVQATADFAEGDVVLDYEVKGGRRTPTAHFDVVIFAGTNRYAGVRQVGDGQ